LCAYGAVRARSRWGGSGKDKANGCGKDKVVGGGGKDTAKVDAKDKVKKCEVIKVG
jgi:hypothetical protein